MEIVAILLILLLFVGAAIYANNKDGKNYSDQETQTVTDQQESVTKETTQIAETAANEDPFYHEAYQKYLENDHPIAKIFYILGVGIFIIGFFTGLIAANSYYGFSFGIFFAWFISSFISGMIFIGFGEIIKLLHMQVKESKVQSIYLKDFYNHQHPSD